LPIDINSPISSVLSATDEMFDYLFLSHFSDLGQDKEKYFYGVSFKTPDLNAGIREDFSFTYHSILKRSGICAIIIIGKKYFYLKGPARWPRTYQWVLRRTFAIISDFISMTQG